jgi:hypothetical protein
MGLFDNLKMATGLGLDPQETYRRAFEKGVLLGVSRFDEAATMFKEAAEKLRGVDAALSQRASANACVYGFLATRDPQMAAEAVRVLRAIDKVEVPGTDRARAGVDPAARVRAVRDWGGRRDRRCVDGKGGDPGLPFRRACGGE